MKKKLKIRSGDDWAEIRPGATPPEDWPALTVALESGYRQAFVEELKCSLPPGSRLWIEERRSWFILPSYQNLAQEIACRHYSNVWVVVGSDTRDLKTGMVQVGLFSDGGLF